MRKTKEQKNKLSRSSVVLSIILHILLFSFIILGSLKQIIKLGGGEVVDAIMVDDPGAVIKQYNQLQQQQNNTKQAEAKRNKRLQQQEEKLIKQEEEEQKQLKIIEEEHIKIEREAKKQAKEKQKRAEEKSAMAKAKAEQERLIKEQAEKKARAKKEAEIIKAKAQAETKEKAEKAAKALALAAKKKADAEKQADALNLLLSGLTAKKPSQETGTAVASPQRGNRKSGASSSDLANYAGKIKIAIESKFYDADIYHGKTCELSIKLAPDGMLISITAKNNTANDQSLCDAAIRATKTARMPKPPSRSIYDAFNEQGSYLVFKP
ncbi:MAG: cell envelope integrity protein TolA [Arsenophonus sp. NEOnobi-MAG3]